MRKPLLAAVAFMVALIGVAMPAGAPAARAATNPKVAIIVGATGAVTPRYRADADEVAAQAARYTNNIVKVYSPNATWPKVKAAVKGASIVVYLGHGNGWPSPYTYDPNYTTKDGFGLNYDLNGNGNFTDSELKYYGEPSIRELDPAPNAVVLLFHLCYASGNAEAGAFEPSVVTARKRIDNYAAGFQAAGFKAVIVDGHSTDYYIDALFTTRQSMIDLWRNAPNYHGHETDFASVRTPGTQNAMDPDAPGYYYRSIGGRFDLRTLDVTGAAYSDTSRDPATMVVPGNASPVADASPVYDSVDTLLAGGEPAATLGTADKVRVDWAESGVTAPDASPVYRVHTDGGVEGWMAGSALVPRDVTAPRLWAVEDGTGTFSPDGDGRQDSYTLSVQLSEPSDWTIRIRSGWKTLATFDGSGDTAAIEWAPAAGSVADGTFTWELGASDTWGNGPLWETGRFEVDTNAPDLGLAAAPSTPPVVTPNADGAGDVVAFAATSSEMGSVEAVVRNGTGETVRTLATVLSASGARVLWNGKDAAGVVVPDGIYTVDLTAIDPAGNASDPQTRDVAVYTGLGFVHSSRVVFFPQDGDALAAATGFGFTLAAPATVDWTIVNAAGTVVRTLKTAEPLEAGTYDATWDGTSDAGAMVARGTYRSVVRATDGTLVSTQAAAVVADAFKIAVSDLTPARGQKITITATSAEGLGAAPKLRIYQPGVPAWTVTMTRVSAGVYRVTIRLHASHTGALRLRVTAPDTTGAAQGTLVALPLH
ncbi:MAG: FlgD immunoglobulin-like domain containing protein [Chloroflexota bacterium]